MGRTVTLRLHCPGCGEHLTATLQPAEPAVGIGCEYLEDVGCSNPRCRFDQDPASRTVTEAITDLAYDGHPLEVVYA